MSEDKPPEPWEDIARRLREARAGRDAGQRPQGSGSAGPLTGFGMAFRIGVELVAALMMGVGIGLLLDNWLGTAPWFLVVFFFLGAAAGVLNVYRAASGLGTGVGYGRHGEDGPEDGNDERADRPD